MNPYDLVIADLQQKRDELDRVIAMLKVMRGDPQSVRESSFAELGAKVYRTMPPAGVSAIGGQFPPAGPEDRPVEFRDMGPATVGVPVGGGVLVAPLPTQRAPGTGKVTVAKP